MPNAYYELRTTPSAGAAASRSTERFSEALAAFARQSALEATLVASGWCLESYESLVVERPRLDSIAV